MTTRTVVTHRGRSPRQFAGFAASRPARSVLPEAPPLTTWAVLHFVPDGLGPEANAIMGRQHPGQPILTFKLKIAGNVERGIVPA